MGENEGIEGKNVVFLARLQEYSRNYNNTFNVAVVTRAIWRIIGRVGGFSAETGSGSKLPRELFGVFLGQGRRISERSGA